MARVWVAMSGGVDSSVAAALLVDAGHEVTGVTMQLWPSGDQEGGCCSVAAARDARRVCDDLGIAHYVLNFRERFEDDVVGPFAGAYAQGRTPNPCIDCNDRLKFSDLLARVRTQGADALATGHYARIERDARDVAWLARGVDRSKDQSYFLYRLSRVQMEHVLFPVGAMAKSEVRAAAAARGLPTAEKRESQDTCFATAGDHLPVVLARHPAALEPGDIVDTRGCLLGRHDGLARYTIGQRKGLGLAGGPWFVVSLDPGRNAVVVGGREDLVTTRVTAGSVVWHAADSVVCEAVVRYRMAPVAAQATLERGLVAMNGTGETAVDSLGRLLVDFDRDVGAAAPGQSVVCYGGDRVLGGGVIECAS